MNDLNAARGIVRGALIGALIWAGAIASCARASELTVGVNVGSYHHNAGYYEKWTPGLYATYGSRWFVSGGAYHNSIGTTTYHAGGGYRYEFGRYFDASLAIGVSYGYRDWWLWVYPDGSEVRTYGPAKLLPFGAPSLGVRDPSTGLGARLFVIPPVSHVKTWTLSASVEWTFR